jgi:hypothetical protein
MEKISDQSPVAGGFPFTPKKKSAPKNPQLPLATPKKNTKKNLPADLHQSQQATNAQR